MKRGTFLSLILAGAASLALLAPASALADAGKLDNAGCLSCHDSSKKKIELPGKDDEKRTLAHINAGKFGKGIHGEMQCVACHKEKSPTARPTTPRTGAAALRAGYLDYLRHEVAGDLSLDWLKIALDCANGAASALAPQLFTALGAQVTALHCAPNGQNINRDCGSLHIAGLQAAVTATGADLGVAFDGDADRSLFVDAHGAFVDGDATLWALAQHLDAQGALPGGLVIATVMSNIGLEMALATRGWTLRRANVGDKYVLEELLATGAAIGGGRSSGNRTRHCRACVSSWRS